ANEGVPSELEARRASRVLSGLRGGLRRRVAQQQRRESKVRLNRAVALRHVDVANDEVLRVLQLIKIVRQRGIATGDRDRERYLLVGWAGRRGQGRHREIGELERVRRLGDV